MRSRRFGSALVIGAAVALGALATRILATGVSATVGQQQPSVVAPQHRPSGSVEFKAVLDLEQTGDVQQQLRGGRVAVSRDWPASLFATFLTPDGRGSCTAALIGPEVILTAAHCVPTKGQMSFSFEGHEEPYVLICAQHPDYVDEADDSADFALCKTDRPFAAPVGFLYETVDTSAMVLLIKTTMILGGYGCISDIAAQDDIDGKYRIGFNTVDEISTSPGRKRGDDCYVPHEKNNLLTTEGPGLANLCPGDSGGPAYRRTGGASQFAKRVIVGVNSRVFYKDDTKTSYGASLISATGGPAFRRWSEDWARDSGVSACGVRGVLAACRR